ncbi:substrate-binding domain-containing protein [Pseudooceanicola sp. CBS1P-1]|nr:MULTISPECIES: LacI family DNA-binding transcriptional regulator [Pseudooceanicola]MBT9386811.1 substrate-binding domain-containing protein [Pseudooceanicola endophyticus]
METVGRLAGVSQVTVSRALSDPSKVSPATLEKIRQAIAQTGFVPNALAGALATSRSMLISALVPAITNVVYASMVKSFSDRLREQGYQILLSETGFDPLDEEKVIAAHLSRRPDAILLTGIYHSAKSRQMLLGSGIPVVEVWDHTDTPIDICVGFRHAETGRAAADYAVSRGYEAAATISAGDERALRRKDAFIARYTHLTARTVPEINLAGSATLAHGRECLRRLLEERQFRAGVIFCSSDLLAHGVIIEAAAQGLRVPQDIAVIGFGDQEFAADVEPAITTVRVDRDAFGRAAADAVLARLDRRDTGGHAIDLGFKIVRRGSA